MAYYQRKRSRARADPASEQRRRQVSPQAAGDKRTDDPTSVQPFKLRGRTITAISLHISAPLDAKFYGALDVRLRQAPQFFKDAPVVIDLSEANDQADVNDLRKLIDNLRRRGMGVFGVQDPTRTQRSAALSLGLIPVLGGREVPMRDRSAEAPAKTETETEAAPADTEPLSDAPAAPASATATRTVTTPIRSGQSVVAETGDLIVIGHVSSGAELVATGNIHVYGQIRGRAIAGADGDTSARIFCQSLDAELLAIAGVYLTSEDIQADVRKKTVQVHLDRDDLKISPFG